jgi:hypothetical protein
MKLEAVCGANELALVEVYQDKRTLHGTYHQRAKILIQHQNTTIHTLRYGQYGRETTELGI